MRGGRVKGDGSSGSEWAITWGVPVLERVPDLVILCPVTEGLLDVPGLTLGAVFGLMLPDVFVRGWVFVVERSYSMRIPSCFEVDL